MITPDLVSVIIPVRNRARLLQEAVQSCLAQTHRPIEIIIVDDSTDETTEVARRFAAEHPGEVAMLPQDGRGIGAARNIGLTAARGEFIQFLDSDDLLMPEKFSRQVAGLRAHPDCGISYCGTREYRVLAEPMNVAARRSGEMLTHLFPALVRGRVWPSPSPLYRRSTVDAIGPFGHHSIYEDWEFESRAAALGVRLHHCPELLADKRDAHRVEGRRKGGVPLRQARDYAEVVLLIFSAACDAGIAADALGGFAPRLLMAGRQCAAAGHVDLARRCLDLAVAHALPPQQSRFVIYRRLSDRFGWRAVGVIAERSVRVGRAAWRARRWPAAGFHRWRHRVRHARRLTAGQPLSQWSALLAHAWNHRRSRREL